MDVIVAFEMRSTKTVNGQPIDQKGNIITALKQKDKNTVGPCLIRHITNMTKLCFRMFRDYFYKNIIARLFM